MDPLFIVHQPNAPQKQFLDVGISEHCLEKFLQRCQDNWWSASESVLCNFN
jgi:hypothetical protein